MTDTATGTPAQDAPPAHLQPGEPSFFMCIELVPLLDDPRVFDDLNTAQLFDVATTSPHLFARQWTMFRSLADAEAYTHRSATLTVLPLIVAANPLLGY